MQKNSNFVSTVQTPLVENSNFDFSIFKMPIEPYRTFDDLPNPDATHNRFLSDSYIGI